MKLEEEISQKAFRNNKHKAIVNIIFSYNWLLTNHFKLLKPYDLTIQQFNILRILRGQYPNPATVKLLKERMLDKMSDASNTIIKDLQNKIKDFNYLIEYKEKKIRPISKLIYLMNLI